MGKSYGGFGNNVRFERFDRFKKIVLVFDFFEICSSLDFDILTGGRTPAVWGFDMSCSGIVRLLRPLPKELSSHWEKVMEGLGTTFVSKDSTVSKKIVLVFDFFEICSSLGFDILSGDRRPAVWGFNMSCSGIVRLLQPLPMELSSH